MNNIITKTTRISSALQTPDVSGRFFDVVIPAVEIVPGDIIEHEAGDLAPADVQLFKSASLKCVEAALTSESEAVSKRAVTSQTLRRSESPPAAHPARRWQV